MQTTELQSLLRMAATLSRLGAWMLDLRTGEVTWSDEVRAIHEVTADYQPSLQKGLDFYAPEYVAAISQAMRRCMEMGEPFDLELVLITARGRRVWVRALGEALRDANGRIVKLQGAFQDISASKALADKNRALSERLTRTLESMSDAFLTLDRDWRFTFVNTQAELLLQRPREEILGQVAWEEFPQAAGSIFQREYERAFAENQPVQFEAFYPPLDKWFHVRVFPSDDMLAIYFHDHTETVRAKEAMQRLNAELESRVEARTSELKRLADEMEAFSYSIAHDLRAPLASISGYSQVLEEHDAAHLSERGKGYLRKVRTAAQKMDLMIQGLLAVARLPSSRIHKVEFDLSACARQVLARLALAEPGREVSATIDRKLVVRGDPVLLEQVMHNLLANAWKFTSKTPQARIHVGSELDAEGQHVYFVRDNGAGFDMAYAQRLFEVFNRLHTESEFPGSGVGLATVKRVVQRHGGTVWADAQPGQGATIYFTLPA